MPLKPLPRKKLPKYEVGDALPIEGWVVDEVGPKYGYPVFYHILVNGGDAEVNCSHSELEQMVYSHYRELKRIQRETKKK